jgi:hypothetical protein
VGSGESEKDNGGSPTPIPDKYIKGDGPEYVTVGKFGPNVGITEVTQVLRLNNICNDLGLDTASTGSAIAWAMELYQRGIITREQTQLDLEWGNYETVERLLFMTAKREGFGDVIADSSQAVATGNNLPFSDILVGKEFTLRFDNGGPVRDYRIKEMTKLQFRDKKDNVWRDGRAGFHRI